MGEVMASVDLRPGDTLNIVWSSVQDTPLGRREVESNFSFSYEELLMRLKTKVKGEHSKQSNTEGAKFSRLVALALNALKKGKWSTGTDIDKRLVFDKFFERFQALEEFEYKNLTERSKVALKDFYKESILDDDQQKKLKTMIEALGIKL